jgi:hypothetical protein
MRHLAAAVLLSSAFASSTPANAATSYSSLGVGSGGYTYGYFDARSYAGISFTLKNDLAHGEVRQIGLGDLQSLSFYTFYLLRDFPGQYPHDEAMFNIRWQTSHRSPLACWPQGPMRSPFWK